MIAPILVPLCLLAPAPPDAGPDFDREIRPILAGRCFTCHGPDASARRGGLRLDLRADAIASRDDGAAIVPGDASSSLVVRRIESSDPKGVMPPRSAGEPLPERERAALRRWIDAGAEWSEHWSFVPVRRPSVPHGAPHPIDAFIRRRLAEAGLDPAAPAPPHRLLRRLSLDLTGLPPSPEDADGFAAETSPVAWERAVDRYLASAAFGERFAWDWLDAARYADSNGYQGDRERTMWPWRDWVIDAFDAKLPWDEFTIWQLAGDLLPGASFEQKLATGFCRNHMINGEGGRIPEENRIEYVFDMTETVGTVWLGLTLTCSRCHDHKFDPLTRRDYFGLFDFFNQTPVDGSGGDPAAAPNLAAPTIDQSLEIAAIDAWIDRTTEEIRRLEAERTGAAIDDDVAKILAKSPRARDAKEYERLAAWAGSESDYGKVLAEWRGRAERRDAVSKAAPRVMVMADRKERRTTYVLEKGLYNQPRDPVPPSVPEALPGLEADVPMDRLALARWLTRPENPLPARVTVNRLWMHFFGRGLVATPEDFGTRGERPTHPELLDWLADEFRRSDWSIEHLCRLIVTSETYRQDSDASLRALEVDPDNRLLSRGSRYRLPSWAIRDQALAVSGLLVRKVGGAPVHPYQPDGVWAEATFGAKRYPKESGESLYRRSIYTFWRRIVGPTIFFDTAARQVCSVVPARTNTPLHALTTLNDVTYAEAARVLAVRSWQERPDPRGALERIFRRVVVRPIEPRELDVLLSAFDAARAEFRADPGAARRLLAVGNAPAPDAGDDEHAAALAAAAAVAGLVLNLDEALTKE